MQRALPNSGQMSVKHKDYWLDVALQDSFPCSDPISSMRSDYWSMATPNRDCRSIIVFVETSQLFTPAYLLVDLPLLLTGLS
jgi:hypothetical protein